MTAEHKSASPSVWDRPTGCGCLGAALGVLALALALSALVAWLATSHTILPGVTALGIDLGGMRVSQASEALQIAWEERSLVLEASEKLWVAHPADLGLLLDTASIAQQAYLQGRDIENLGNYLRQRGQIDLQPSITFDRATAENTLNGLADSLYSPPQPTSVRIVAGRVELADSLAGAQLDAPATLDWLESHVGSVVSERRMALIVSRVSPQTLDTGPALAQAQGWLSTPLTLNLYDPVHDERMEWNFSPEQIGTWIVIAPAEDGSETLECRLDPARIQVSLDAAGAGLGSERSVDAQQAAEALVQALQGQQATLTLQMHYAPRQHTVQAGETLSRIAYDYGLPYPWIQSANPGLGTLSVGQTLVIPAADALLPLPAAPNKRIRVSLSEQRVRIYQDAGILWDWPASTGLESSPTSPGLFQIQSHVENAYAANWDLWMPYFMGIYRPVPEAEFMNGFHGFPSRGGRQLLWTNNLGEPVTYGCILLSTENAQTLYQWAEEGVVVEITR